MVLVVYGVQRIDMELWQNRGGTQPRDPGLAAAQNLGLLLSQGGPRGYTSSLQRCVPSLGSKG